MGLPRGKGRSTAPVLEGIAQGVEDFYKRVVEGLRPYVPPAPQLPKEEPEAEERIEVEAASQENKPAAPRLGDQVTDREEPRLATHVSR